MLSGMAWQFRCIPFFLYGPAHHFSSVWWGQSLSTRPACTPGFGVKRALGELPGVGLTISDSSWVYYGADARMRSRLPLYRLRHGHRLKVAGTCFCCRQPDRVHADAVTTYRFLEGHQGGAPTPSLARACQLLTPETARTCWHGWVPTLGPPLVERALPFSGA